MSYTQSQIDALRAAIAKGVSRVRMGDEELQFRSLTEMRSLLAEMEAQVSGTASRQHYPTFAVRPE